MAVRRGAFASAARTSRQHARLAGNGPLGRSGPSN